MRNAFANTFYEAAKRDSKLCVVVADISPAGSMQKFRDEFPDRFVNTGVAEQVMIGMVAGMALRGLRPVAYTIATFALFRPYEFVRDDLCYQNLPVTVVGIGGGVTYSTLGGTHHAMEDVSLASAIPNMKVIAPCDAAETRAATLWCLEKSNGPVYLRLGKAGEPDLTSQAPDAFEYGKVRWLKRAASKDVAILSYGPIMKTAFAVAERFEKAGAGVSVASVHTIKPLDRESVARALRDHKRVVVIEECVPRGGLAGHVKEIAWDTKADCTLDTFTLQDEFIHNYGSHNDLLAAHGLSADKIASRLQLA